MSFSLALTLVYHFALFSVADGLVARTRLSTNTTPPSHWPVTDNSRQVGQPRVMRQMPTCTRACDLRCVGAQSAKGPMIARTFVEACAVLSLRGTHSPARVLNAPAI